MCTEGKDNGAGVVAGLGWMVLVHNQDAYHSEWKHELRWYVQIASCFYTNQRDYLQKKTCLPLHNYIFIYKW